MTNIINEFHRKRDKTEVSKIIGLLQRINETDSQLSQDNLTSIFHRTNKIYKHYSQAFSQAIKNNNDEEIDFNFNLFAQSSLLCIIILSKKGFYEVEREVITYFISFMKPNLNIPTYIVNAINNANSENALRLAVVKSDNPENKEQVEYYLNMVQDYLYQQVDLAKPEKIGELALFQFLKGNKERSQDYLEMQFQKYSQNIDKVIKTEITNNQALFDRSLTGKEYKKFVENFIALKYPPKPQYSLK